MRKYCLVLFMLAGFCAYTQESTFIIDQNAGSLIGYIIVIPVKANAVEVKAAKELQHYIEKMTMYRLNIVRDTMPRAPLEIVIGNCYENKYFRGISQLDPDGFNIRTGAMRIYIAGGSRNGVLFGVYDFLEKYAECRFYAPGIEEIPRQESIKLNKVNRTENPAFRSREVYYAGMDDQDFADKMRCNRLAWKGTEDWGMWVHTMFTLVPPDKYFDTHPEYYALMAGKREKTQLCLTNPDVL